MVNKNFNLQFCSADIIRREQELSLKQTLAYLKEHSRFYQRMFQQNGIDISKISTLEGLRQIPVTTKDDLQKFNHDFLCVPREDVFDYVTTSGTLGDPVTFCLTRSDIDRLAYNEQLSFSTVGCGRGDILQLMTTIDRRFMAGLAYFLGARDLNCGVVRVGNGIPEFQWDTIHRIHPTFCVVVPSFLIKLVQYAKAHDIDISKCSLKRAICIGEALRTPAPDFALSTLGQQIAKAWPSLELFSTYASTEMQTSFTECPYHCGGHLPPELIIVEFLDDNNQPVPDDRPGEVTITTLGVEGMPLLRFKTGDICYHYTTPCRCGRQTMRLSSVLGRKKQMIKYKGTTLYPSAFYNILDGISGIKNYIVEAYTNELGTDSITVHVGSDRTDAEFLKSIKDIFRSKIRVAPDIVFESAEAITKKQFPPMNRKPILFNDLRKCDKIDANI